MRLQRRRKEALDKRQGRLLRAATRNLRRDYIEGKSYVYVSERVYTDLFLRICCYLSIQVEYVDKVPARETREGKKTYLHKFEFIT